MVRNKEMKPKEFLSIAMDALKTEEDEVLLGTLLGRWSPVRNIYTTYLTVQERSELAPAFEKVFWERYQSAKRDSSLEIIFLDFYISSFQSPEARMNVFTMLKENRTIKGKGIDQDRRWSMIKILASHNFPEILELITQEEAKDSSTLGKRYALASRVAIPDEASKKKYFEILRPKNLLFSDFREAADYFFNVNDSDLNSKFLKPFYEKVRSIDWKSHDDLVDLFFDRFFPYEVCTLEHKKLSQSALKSAKNLTSIARKSWLEANDELSRCVGIREAKR
jgi:hypothetical protein